MTVEPLGPLTDFRSLPLSLLQESPNNPRRASGDLGDLVESVKEKGVLQPVLVRPRGAEVFELVFGHRRFRAAREAGLDAIPAMVREMTDTEVLEAQIVENCQREDIHPLDEADGYRRLHEDHGYSIEDLVAKVGKSRGYVYARMKLCALVEPARRAFLDGKLNPSTALLIARIPDPELQKQATKEVTRGRWEGDSEPMSVRMACDHIHRSYMLRLSDAPFKVTDADLLPEAGSCSTCPKRTGNQRELFDDVKSADVCTDPRCFERKGEASWRRRVAEAEAKGQKVLSEKEAKQVLLSPSRSGLVDLDACCYEDPKKRTWRCLLGKARPEPAIARDEAGRVHELIPVKDAKVVLKKKGHDFAVPRSPSTDRYAAEGRRRKKKAQIGSDVRRKIHEALREKLAAKLNGPGSLGREDLELIAAGLYRELWADRQQWIAGLYGWVFKRSRWDAEQVLPKNLAPLSVGELTVLLLDLALAREVHASAWEQEHEKSTALMTAAKRYGVNASRIRREVMAVAAAKKAATKKSPRQQRLAS